MLRIYFDEVFKDKTASELERIKIILMAVNIHIAASSLTKAGFVLVTASAVSTGMHLSLDMASLTTRATGVIITAAGLYGIVQKAADCANRLRFISPAYYVALYAQELEMLYFLVEPLFERAGAFGTQRASNEGLANIITRMIR